MTDGATCQQCGAALRPRVPSGRPPRRFCSDHCQQAAAFVRTRPARLRRRAAQLEMQAAMYERRVATLRAQVAVLRELADAES